MANTEQSLVVGIFNDVASANEAIAALQRAGFRSDQIQRSADAQEEHGLFSGVKGLFSSGRASDKDVFQDLIDMGIAPEEARLYQQEYAAHHTLVSVTSNDRLSAASTILLNHGAYGPRGRMAADASAADAARANREPGRASTDIPAAATGAATSADTADEQHMRLHAEQLQAYKRPVQTGEVTLHKEIITEQQTIDVPVTREEVVIERRSMAGDAASAEAIGEDETIRIPISEEQVNVSKQTVATGDVTVSKRKVEETQQFSDSVRHEEARVEQEGDVPIWENRGDQQPPAQPGI
jgi:uncharacterized protein (TIGR02271 family)